MSKQKKGKNFIIGSVVGGIIGAATALFLAPKSGKELRDDLNEQATLVKEKTGTWKNTAIEKGNELAGVAKEKTASLSKTVSEQSSQLMTKVKELRPSSSENGESAEEDKSNDTVENTVDIQKKLEETQKAFDEAEHTVKQ
ncbi:YtxH domain-containing protein [Bacillus timonensis]|nr:YtxH domain-containing protein [Bacillus timonensis]